MGATHFKRIVAINHNGGDNGVMFLHSPQIQSYAIVLNGILITLVKQLIIDFYYNIFVLNGND